MTYGRGCVVSFLKITAKHLTDHVLQFMVHMLVAHLCRYPEGDLETNLTVVITNVGADFTRLGSFGDAEQFGGNVVAQMDRSYLNRSWSKPKIPPQVYFTDSMQCVAENNASTDTMQ